MTAHIHVKLVSSSRGAIYRFELWWLLKWISLAYVLLYRWLHNLQISCSWALAVLKCWTGEYTMCVLHIIIWTVADLADFLVTVAYKVHIVNVIKKVHSDYNELGHSCCNTISTMNCRIYLDILIIRFSYLNK